MVGLVMVEGETFLFSRKLQRWQHQIVKSTEKNTKKFPKVLLTMVGSEENFDF